MTFLKAYQRELQCRFLLSNTVCVPHWSERTRNVYTINFGLHFLCASNEKKINAKVAWHVEHLRSGVRLKLPLAGPQKYHKEKRKNLCFLTTGNAVLEYTSQSVETMRKSMRFRSVIASFVSYVYFLNFPDESSLPPGMPEYIASGSHTFNKLRYRFLVLPRYKFDLHSVIKNRCIDEKNLLVIAVQTLDVLEHLHGKGYVHADIKAANMMIGTCPGRSTKEEYHCSDEDDDYMTDFEQSDSNQSVSNKSNSTNDEEQYSTPLLWSRPRVRTNVQFSGTNPIRSCRKTSRKTSVYDEMLNYHYLRPHKKIDYSQYDDADDDFENQYSNKDDDLEANSHYNKVYSQKSTRMRQKVYSSSDSSDGDDRIFLIDFGLALKYLDSNGQHKPFCMDERRAHDGTLEFTSRDAHMGAHSRRSDLECLGFNLIFWSQGWLPWQHEKLLTQPEQVHRVKEHFMTDIVEMLKQVYGDKVPKYLGEFLEYVGELAYHTTPDYNFCRSIFLSALQKMGVKAKDFKIDVNILKSNPRCSPKNEMKKPNEKLKNVKEFNIRSLLPAGENGSAKVSPKNLRSKSDKIPKRQRKKFSWTDVLNSDPDQIAKQRAEKEYENDQTETPVVVKYSGKPNYVILRLENRLKFKDRLDIKEDEEVNSENEIKPDVDIRNKKKTLPPLQRDDVKKLNGNGANGQESIRRRKSGLRRVIRVPSKCVPYRESLSKKRRSGNSEFTPTDDSSCSSNSSLKESQPSMSSVSDEDSRDTTDYTPIKTRIKTKGTIGTKKVLKRKLHRNIRSEYKFICYTVLFLNLCKVVGQLAEGSRVSDFDNLWH